MNRNLGDVVAGVLYVAIIFVLVRPGSVAADAVKQIGAALTAMVGKATDLN